MSRARKAPRAWFEFVPDWRAVPMAYWVHRPDPGRAGGFAPAAPSPCGRRGFAVLCVEVGMHVLRFSSAPQLDHAIDVLARKPLPSSARLTREGHGFAPGPAPLGPNNHWLSRLPATLKTSKTRSRLVAALRAVRAMQVAGDAFVVPP
jgi:hypothetical protein